MAKNQELAERRRGEHAGREREYRRKILEALERSNQSRLQSGRLAHSGCGAGVNECGLALPSEATSRSHPPSKKWALEHQASLTNLAVGTPVGNLVVLEKEKRSGKEKGTGMEKRKKGWGEPIQKEDDDPSCCTLM